MVEPQTGRPKTAPTSTLVTFQVGLSSDQATTYSAVLLYFLSPGGPGARGTPEERGIYTVELDGLMDARALAAQSQEKGAGGTVFYAEAISFRSAGDHTLRLLKWASTDIKREVIAQAVVHVRDRPEKLWFPFSTASSSGGAEQQKTENGEYAALEGVFTPKGTSAVPKPPRPIVYQKFPAPGQPLPVLIPTTGEGTHAFLSMNNSTLVIKFDREIEGFFPSDFFLTRWWLNGKPVQLDPKLDPPPQARALAATATYLPLLNSMQFGAADWSTKEVRFELIFDPGVIGAKKGDHVGVQLLYCPEGFLETGPAAQWDAVRYAEASSEDAFSRTSFSELSNRIEFISDDEQSKQ